MQQWFKHQFLQIGLVFITILFSFRGVFPYFIYLFLVLAPAYFIYYLFTRRHVLIGALSTTRMLTPFWIISVFYLIAFATTGYIITYMLIELPNMLVAVLLAFIWAVEAKISNNTAEMIKRFLEMLLWVSVLAAVAGLIKYIFAISGVKFQYFENQLWSQTTSLNADSNFYSLVLISGLIIIIERLYNELITRIRIFYQSLMLILSLAVLFSTSRRGVVLLVIVYAAMGLLWILSLLPVKNKQRYLNIRRNSKYFVIISFLSIVFLTLIIFFTSVKFKNELFSKLGLDFKTIRYSINSISKDYASIFTDKYTFKDFDRIIWREKEKKMDESDSNVKLYEQFQYIDNKYKIYPYFNNNSESFDYDNIAILVDKTTESSLWVSKKSNENLAYAYQQIGSIPLKRNTAYIASAWIYVSENCNFDEVSIRANFAKSGFQSLTYNFAKKGSWQYISTGFWGIKDTTINLSLFTGIKDELDFKNVNGFALLKDIAIKQVSNNKVISDEFFTIHSLNMLDSSNNNLNKPVIKLDDLQWSDFKFDPKKNIYSRRVNQSWVQVPVASDAWYTATLWCYVSPDFNAEWVMISPTSRNTFNEKISYDMRHKGTWQKLRLVFSTKEEITGAKLYIEQNSIDGKFSESGYILLKDLSFEPYVFDSEKYGKIWQINSLNKSITMAHPYLKGENMEAVVVDNTLKFKTKQNAKGESRIVTSFAVTYLKVKAGRSYTASVMVNPINNFNANSIALYVPKKFVTNNFKKQFKIKDLKNWQKIDLSFTANTDTVFPLVMSINKIKSDNPADLKGQLLLALPTHNGEKFADAQILNLQKDGLVNDIVTDSISDISNEMTFGDKIRNFFDKWMFPNETDRAEEFIAKGNYIEAAKVYVDYLNVHAGDTIALNNLNEIVSTEEFKNQAKAYWDQLNARYLSNYVPQIETLDTIDKAKAEKQLQINNNVETKKSLGKLILEESDSLDFEEPEILGDTAIIEINFEGQEMAATRLERWLYAKHLFINEYSVTQKLFGNGFKYMNKFANQFLGNPKSTDYPHNVAISAFLYSGLLGGLAYIVFLVYVFYYYFKLRRKYAVLAIMTFLTFIFAMSSGNSHFGVPLFAVLSFLPFVLIRNENQNNQLN